MNLITVKETPHFFALSIGRTTRPRFDAIVEDIKALPRRKYDPETKTWAVPITERKALDRLLARWENADAQATQAILDEVQTPYVDLSSVVPSRSLTDPWPHQLQGLRYGWQRPAALFDLQMGAGKSRIIVDYTINKPNLKRVLIVCPLAVVGVWERQFQTHAPQDSYALVKLGEGAGTVTRKMDKAQATLKEAQAKNVPAVVVINYDSVWREPFNEWALDAKFDVVVGDEVQRLQSAGSNVSRFMHRLGRVVPVRFGLSGTPFQDKPLNAYGVYRYLDPSIFGTNYRQFCNTYAIMGGFQNYQILRYINQDQMREKINRIRFHVAPEGLVLPEAVHADIPLTLPLKAQRLYQSLEDDFYAKVGTGEIGIANAAVALIRLQQLTSGYLPLDYETDEEAGTVETRVDDLHTLKKDALTELLSDLPEREPVVVFCRFRYDLDMIHAAAQVAGRTSKELSGRNMHRVTLDNGKWVDGPETVLAVQIRAGSVGVDLTRAAHAVYYSYSFSLGDFDQSLARIRRPGQHRSCFYHHLVMQGTVDEKIRKALSSKRAILDALLEVD